MPSVTAASSVPRSATAVDLPVAADELGELPPELAQHAERQGFEGETGQTLAIVADEGQPTQILVGVGPRDEVSTTSLRLAAAALARAVAKHEWVATNLVGQLESDQRAGAISAVVEGVKLAGYRYRGYKAESKPAVERVTIVASGRGIKADLARAEALADAVVLARDLTNEPGGSLTPESFAAKATEAAATAGLGIEVWDEKRIGAEKLGGLIAVNQGSVNPPRLVHLSYAPEGAQTRVVLVGKGITFDSGGLSLKTAAGMATMKVDMAGGAAVLAAMTALTAHDVPVAVDGYIPLTDNMTGGDAQRPGDVFRARNGTTVEVLNTDAEGRLVLADALALAAESEPDAIIDIATLTGSASGALGTSYAALMANDDDLAAALTAASDRTGEKIWRLPLPEEYRPQLDSTVADLKNIGAGPYGGALVAGLFLQEFVADTNWAHLDLGLSAMTDVDKGLTVGGATGFGVRLLVDTLLRWSN